MAEVITDTTKVWAGSRLSERETQRQLWFQPPDGVSISGTETRAEHALPSASNRCARVCACACSLPERAGLLVFLHVTPHPTWVFLN